MSTAPTPDHPRFTPVAERGLLVEFGEAISDGAHLAVLALDQALARTPSPGVGEAVPAFASLLVTFDPVVTDHPAVEQALRHLLTRRAETAHTPTLHEVAVCYDADLAPDLADVARQTGLTPEAVIAAHLAGEYRVYMYGFAPGYAYLAGVPPALRLDRKPAAVRGIGAGSVLIAGPQCIVSTLTMPTGWWIIGRSPTAILLPDPARPFLFDVGDRVRFRRIGRAEHEALAPQVPHG